MVTRRREETVTVEAFYFEEFSFSTIRASASRSPSMFQDIDPRLCWASLRSILTLETITLRISRYCSMNKLVLLRMFDDSDCKLKKTNLYS